MNHRHLKAGDRVHFPGMPREKGTLIPHSRTGNQFVIVWDRRPEGQREFDIDECWFDGQMTTTAGRVQLLEDFTNTQIRRQRVRLAEQNVARGRAAQERFDAEQSGELTTGRSR